LQLIGTTERLYQKEFTPRTKEKGNTQGGREIRTRSKNEPGREGPNHLTRSIRKKAKKEENNWDAKKKLKHRDEKF